MEQKIFNWNEGGGSLDLKYDSEKSGPIVMTSSVNEGLDREVKLVVSAKRGMFAEKRQMTVMQEGKREKYLDANAQAYVTADDLEYQVLKQKYAQ